MMRHRVTTRWWATGLAVAAAAWPPAAARAEARTGDRIVAFVNDEVITQGDLNSQLSTLLREQAFGTVEAEQAAQLKEALVARLIEARLIMQEAKRLGLTVMSDEVAKELDRLRQRAGSPEAYAAMLEQTGLTEEQLKLKLREQLLVQKAIDQQVRARITVTPTEVAKAASVPVKPAGDEVQTYHILIRVSEDRPLEEARKLVNRLFSDILEGKKFEELAKEYSDDPHASDGGLLGWVRQGELLPELDRVLFRLKPGELSGPVQTRLGFHLLKVADRRALQDMQDPDAGLDPRTKVYREKFAQALDRWLTQLRSKAYIELVPE